MNVTSSTAVGQHSRAGAPASRGDNRTDERLVEPTGGYVPVLELDGGGLARSFAKALDGRHPVTVFLSAVVIGYALLLALSVALGLLLTEGLLRIGGVASADEGFVSWLTGHRGPSLTEASLLGSIMAGGVVIPTLVGILAAALACLRRWRVAAFLVAAIAIEAATYRLTVAIVHRERPDVHRLEHLPVNASYFSGHTAASVAVYCGLALVLTSRFQSTWFRVLCWSVALLVPPFVAMARMYRGMHHPLDSAAGLVIGVGAILVAIFAARAAGFAARRRDSPRLRDRT